MLSKSNSFLPVKFFRVLFFKFLADLIILAALAVYYLIVLTVHHLYTVKILIQSSLKFVSYFCEVLCCTG